MASGAIDGKRVWAGEGWAGQCLVYTREQEASTPAPPTARSPSTRSPVPVSYAYNFNLIVPHGDYGDDADDPPPPGVGMASLNAPAQSVLLYEVSGVLANLSNSARGCGGDAGPKFFRVGKRARQPALRPARLGHAHGGTSTRRAIFGGRIPPNPTATQFRNAFGRHNDGSNFLLGDGHAKWLKGLAVSSGLDASGPACFQDNNPPRTGCDGPFHAAGTTAPGIRRHVQHPIAWSHMADHAAPAPAPTYFGRGRAAFSPTSLVNRKIQAEPTSRERVGPTNDLKSAAVVERPAPDARG